MNKKVLIILIVATIFALIFGGIIYINQKNSPDSSMDLKDNEMKTSSDQSNSTNTSLNSKYIEYASSTLQNNTGKRVLFFYANWCPTCRPVDAEIQANSDKIPEELTIIRVNYNDTDTDQAEKELARKYNVTYQHTFVLFDESGNEIAKWNGGGLDSILAKISP